MKHTQPPNWRKLRLRPCLLIWSNSGWDITEASCEELGTWYIWGKEYLGKGTLIPFLLRDEPKEEIRRIFLSDNMKWDSQSCGWAIGAIRTVVPDMMANGICKSEAYAYVAGECGLDLEDIEVLAEADEAIER